MLGQGTNITGPVMCTLETITVTELTNKHASDHHFGQSRCTGQYIYNVHCCVREPITGLTHVQARDTRLYLTQDPLSPP